MWAVVGAVALVTAGAGAGRAEALPAAACAAPRPLGEVTVRSLGTAVSGFPVNAAARAGDRVHVVSMDLEPPRVVTYDLASDRVVGSVDLPVGRRAWAITESAGAVYVGLWNRPAPAPNVFRVDPAAGTAEAVGRVPSDLEFWALAAAGDGQLYAGTDRPAVAVLDPATGEVASIDLPVVAATAQVTAVVVDGGTVYAATRGGEARLYAIDVATREVRLVRDLAGDGLDGIYSLAVAGGRAVAGASGPEATAVVVDTATGAVVASGTAAGDTAIDTAAVTGDGTVLVTAKPSGRLLRVDGDGATVLDTPVGQAPTRALFPDGAGEVIGISAAETVWRWAGGATTRSNLLTAGAVGGPVAVMSLAGTPEGIAAGGNNRLQVHDPDTGAVRHTVVPGEPKDLAWAGDALYLALYPYGELWAERAGALTPVADWDDHYNRPRALAVAPDRLLVGVHDDATEGGALVSVDPRTGATTLDPDALGGTGVASVTDDAGITYLGGEHRSPVVRAVERRTGTTLWESAPAPGGAEVTGLAVLGDEVHALTKDGAYAVLSRVDGTVRHRADLLTAPGGEVVVNGGRVYAVGRDALVRIDPTDRTVTPLVTGLEGHLFERPRIAVGPDCAMYVIRGSELVEVRV